MTTNTSMHFTPRRKNNVSKCRAAAEGECPNPRIWAWPLGGALEIHQLSDETSGKLRLSHRFAIGDVDVELATVARAGGDVQEDLHRAKNIEGSTTTMSARFLMAC